METEAITIAAPPAIHVGSIVNPVSNETISIVIPLSAQLTTVARATIQPCQDCKIEVKTEMPDNIEIKTEILENIEIKTEILENIETQTHSQSIDCQTPSAQIQKSTLTSILQKADKSKGCPFPTCSRYGRAFSRAHDLKRHIARHDTRKERLCDPPSDIRTCGQCGENFLNDSVLERHMNIHAIPTAGDGSVINSNGNNTYSCHLCRKKYTQMSKLKAHMATHDKNLVPNICTLCGNQYENAEKLEEHMKKHTTSILEAQNALGVSDSPKQIKVEDDNDDDFMLEEMLLLNKNPRISSTAGKSSNTNSASGKIRCDYCSKTFKTKWTLSSHVAAHEGRYQFSCSRCGKKFVRKSHYDGHVRSHEAARPYVCDQCGKTFKELKHRREHTKRKHPGNQNAIQNLLDSISACVAEESSMEQAKFTLLMPMNFTT